MAEFITDDGGIQLVGGNVHSTIYTTGDDGVRKLVAEYWMTAETFLGRMERGDKIRLEILARCAGQHVVKWNTKRKRS